jgi:hypothetical protein
VLCIVCDCVLPPGDNPIAVNNNNNIIIIIIIITKNKQVLSTIVLMLDVITS